MKAAGWLRTALHVIGALLAMLVILALARTLRRDGPAALAAWRAADVNGLWMACAAIAGIGGHAVFALGWKRLLADCGVPVTWWQAARLFLISNLGRYLPAGKAWQMGIVGVLAAEHRLPVATLTATTLFQGIVGVGVGALLLALTGSAVLHLGPVWLIAPVAGIVILIASPALIRSRARLHGLIVGRMPHLDTVTSGTMWTLVWTAAASWAAWGFALYAIAAGLLGDAGAPLMTYIAAWIGPFLAGLIAAFAPAGLGVRDELMRSMLTNSGVAPGAAIALMVVARIWTTLAEVVPAIVLLALRRVGSERVPRLADAA